MSAKLTTNVDVRLLRATKFPPEFNDKVDMTKVNGHIIKKWMSDEIARILQTEDDVVTELVSNMLEQRYPNIKELQIALTGFLDKDAPYFCQQLWNLCLSAQKSSQGIPQELLEAKKQELAQTRLEEERAREQAQRRLDADRERERERERRDRSPLPPPRRPGGGRRGGGGRSSWDDHNGSRSTPPPQTRGQRWRNDNNDDKFYSSNRSYGGGGGKGGDNYRPQGRNRSRSRSHSRSHSRSSPPLPPSNRRARRSSSISRASRSPARQPRQVFPRDRSVSSNRDHPSRRRNDRYDRYHSRSRLRSRSGSRSPPPAKRSRRRSPSPRLPRPSNRYQNYHRGGRGSRDHYTGGRSSSRSISRSPPSAATPPAARGRGGAGTDYGSGDENNNATRDLMASRGGGRDWSGRGDQKGHGRSGRLSPSRSETPLTSP